VVVVDDFVEVVDDFVEVDDLVEVVCRFSSLFVRKTSRFFLLDGPLPHVFTVFVLLKVSLRLVIVYQYVFKKGSCRCNLRYIHCPPALFYRKEMQRRQKFGRNIAYITRILTKALHC
jgi:hypothetical protein